MTQTRDSSPIFTIGHSTRTIEEFAQLLQQAGVRRLVDVRSIPRSRTNPQFNLDTLPEELARFQVQHTIMPALGGRRGRQKTVEAGLNSLWKNQSFHNYADYARTAEFREGLDRLKALQSETTCAIMCSEAVWWRCHRRIIADYLLAEGWQVVHIMGQGRLDAAKITPGAVWESSALSYPATPADDH